MIFAVSLIAAALVAAPHARAEEPAFETSALETGLDVVTMESHKVPLVTIVLASKAGAMTETPETNGLTHLWEHMFFKGNKKIPDQEAFKERIRELGITYNGDTASEKVRYYFTLPSVFLDEGLEFMANAISTPLLDKTELEKERQVVLDEYGRSAAQPTFDFRNLVRVLIYGEQNYLRDPLGHREDIETATRKQLFAIKDKVFVPSNSAILVSGDFERKKLMKLLKKHFSNWKDPEDWKAPEPPEFPEFPDGKNFVMTRENAENATVRIVFEGPKARSQPEESFAADVLISLLNHKSGKFYQKFIDSGLTFGAGLSYYTQSQAGELMLYAKTKPEKAQKVRKMLLKEAKKWAKPDYFTKAQLADVRRNLRIDHKRELNKPSSYIKTLAFWWAVTGLDYYGSYLDNLAATGLDEVKKFAGDWFVDEPYISGILVSPENAKKAGLEDTSKKLVKKHLAPDYDVDLPDAPKSAEG